MPVVAALISVILLGAKWLSVSGRRTLIGLIIGLGVLTFLTILAGSSLAGRLAHNVGGSGQGEVVSTYATNMQYNSHDVRGRHMPLHTLTY